MAKDRLIDLKFQVYVLADDYRYCGAVCAYLMTTTGYCALFEKALDQEEPPSLGTWRYRRCPSCMKATPPDTYDPTFGDDREWMKKSARRLKPLSVSSKGYTPPDPVHEEEGKWYHWDETWADRHGPFDTEEKAREALEKYAHFLEHGPEEEGK
jgi:hypothetical protein